MGRAPHEEGVLPKLYVGDGWCGKKKWNGNSETLGAVYGSELVRSPDGGGGK